MCKATAHYTIQINYFSPLFLPVLVHSFLVANLLHVLGKKYRRDELSVAQVRHPDGQDMLSVVLGQSEQRTSLHFLPPKRVRARHVSKDSDPYRQTLNGISFATWSEEKHRIMSVVRCARAHRCLDSGSATSDGVAMHFATRSRAPAYFAARCPTGSYVLC